MKYREFLEQLESCPFCGSGQKEIISKENAFATYALAPYHQDHLLIVPRRHVVSLDELADKEMADVDALEKECSEILKKLGYQDISVFTREGEHSGKTVEHLHYHILPDIQIGAQGVTEDRAVITEDEIRELIKRMESFIPKGNSNIIHPVKSLRDHGTS